MINALQLPPTPKSLGCVCDPYLDLAEIVAGTGTISLAIDDMISYPYFLPVTAHYKGFRLFFNGSTPSDAYHFGLFRLNTAGTLMERILSDFASGAGTQYGGTFPSQLIKAGVYIGVLRRYGQGVATVTPLRCSTEMHPLLSIYSSYGTSQSLLETSISSMPSSWTPNSSYPYDTAPANAQVPYTPLVLDA